MDNASKALLIAGGMLLAILVISTFLLGVNSITDFLKAKELEKTEAQTLAFNNEYLKYNRKDVRGSDVLSLINKVRDNNLNAEYKKANENYQAIKVTVKISKNKNSTNYGTFYIGLVNKEGISGRIQDRDIEKYIKDGNYEVSDSKDDFKKFLADMTEYEKNYAGGSASAMANLTANISNIISLENDGKQAEAKEEFTKFAIISDTKYDITSDSSSNTKWKSAKKAAIEYDQFVKLKRAIFDCTQMDISDSTGKVKNIVFEWKGEFE